ncbi:GNAT family N-acetyltransferase [Microvirga thermotolerans]|uniref:GNAT family N-acetyltransferase n=1 Tax=Microvirga thermotolerans TaxID=2651334 RepID=A0A5P9JX21_9HYPH|nr:GNAT family N-acetyltransferase [Microvirga thermotolerans]QFU16681.1 GNAT family N-acetyltransferase [Microvirga thermotolerans]
MTFQVKIATSLKAVPAADWDACAMGGDNAAGSDDPFNPFVSHAFLSALEEAGCVGPRTGWSPLHLLVEDEAGTLQGAAPCYLKSHSMGEYVFDHAWADAYARAGGHYYPKLQVSIPFTPVGGPRLLAARDPEGAVRAHLVAGLRALREETGASSVHATFLQERDLSALTSHGFLRRDDQQFHWFNEGYGSFEDFLGALASRKRKAIRRERRDALANGIAVEWVTAGDIREHHWDAFFAFYMDTGSRKWGRPYLNRSFFSLLGERLAERILLVMAKRNGRYIAGALNLIGDQRLYGRNWGCIEDHPFLHFEVCYYQAIDFAIARGLDRVEAGAQGEHKLARGYRPVITSSAHDFADASLARAVKAYLDRERSYVSEVAAELSAATPFRQPRDEQD